MFSFLKPKITVATHSGSFHADDVFAVATLSIWAEKNGKRIKVVRTRDPIIIDKADIVVDVGGIYDPEKNRFDHHQREGAGVRENGIPYASFGLVWKHFGEKLTTREIVAAVEKTLVMPIDARDNGINLSTRIRNDVGDYTINREMIYALRASPDGKGFERYLDIAKLIMKCEISSAQKIRDQERKVKKQIATQSEPEILVLNEDIFWDEVVRNYKKITMVVYPDSDTEAWCAETPRDDYNDYSTNRVLFPKSWHGLRDKALIEASGITDAIFCHRGGFFAIAKSREGAIAMAKKALEESVNMVR